MSADRSPNYSPSREAHGFVFVSGQASVDEEGVIVPGTLAQEMERSIGNVERILGGHGLTLADVVRVGAYVHDPADLPEFNRLYPRYFAEPRPVRTTLTSCLTDQIKFELDVVAAVRAVA